MSIYPESSLFSLAWPKFIKHSSRIFRSKIYITFMFRFYRMSDRQILENAMDRNRGSSDMGSAMRWEMGKVFGSAAKTGSSIYLQVFQFNLRIHAATQILSQGTQRWHWVSRWYWWWWWFAWWWYVMMTMTFSEFVIMLIYDGFKLWHIQDM